jgi:hypothetical protein
MFKPITHNGKVLFTVAELSCNCDKCKPKNDGKLATGFDDDLMSLRLYFNKPMALSSCCRCKMHNKAEGGHPRSLHVYDSPEWPTGGTCAIDVRTTGLPQSYRDDLVAKAWQYGWTVGLANSFIHLDKRKRLLGMPQIIYTYSGYNGPMYEKLYKKD